MLDTHPDLIRPDHAGGRFVPSAFTLEDKATAEKMATVILRQASDGQPTSIEHFRDAPETRHLTSDEIARHIGAASRIADRRVIRQDALTVDQPGALPATAWAEQEGSTFSEKSDEELLDIALPAVAQIVTDDGIAGALLALGFRPAAISRIWPRLTVKLAAQVAQIAKPSIGSLARREREQG